MFSFFVISHSWSGAERTLKPSKFSPSVSLCGFPCSLPHPCFLFTDWSLWFLFTFLNLQLVPKFFIIQGIQELAQQARISLPFLLPLSANLSLPITLILHPKKLRNLALSLLSTWDAKKDGQDKILINDVPSLKWVPGIVGNSLRTFSHLNLMATLCGRTWNPDFRLRTPALG